VAENNTYFSSSGRTLGSACTYKVCKCSSDICQLRLDFETFVLNDPLTTTTTLVGNPVVNMRGQCQTDIFGVTAPGFGSVPNICGTNTGYHMYVPASDACNELSAAYGSGSSASSSSLAIKVSQIECSSSRLAPPGCLQYFTSDTGTVESFNYNSGTSVHLASQDYSACFRQARGNCAICFYSPTATPFGVGSAIANNNAVDGVGALCGPAGGAIVAIAGMIDFIEIIGGHCAPPAIIAVTANRYCGTPEFDCAASATGDQTVANEPHNTVCTNNTPFKISFFTDGNEEGTANGEGIAEGAAATNPNSKGFSLSYFQQSTCIAYP